ncbi:MAG: hypothetical protein FJY86_03580 [Candidatus Diapherotrites archaeon]|uniref:Uncharacterized protein n=1 Tax=Candidatus Iainarchaeum sp. TaxID=3101447 RepID=A0A8T4C7H8_9ARCH|nr:hypothetical protein [Candidatus Diapherotrites archaeon]
MVGRNGLVWIHGGNTPVAAETILRIEEYSHAENLTHDIQCFLAARTGTGMPNTQGPSNEDAFETGMNSHYGGRGGRDFGSRGGFNRGRGGFNRGPRTGGFGPRDNRMRGGFDRGFNRMGNRSRGNDRFGNRGFENDAFSSEDRGFGRGNDRAMRERRDDRGERGDRGERDVGERSTSFRPRNNFNRGFGERNRDEGFQMNKRFGRQYDDPQVGGESFNRNPDSFDKRKRFPRDNRDTRNTRVRGDEDPMFE